MWSSDLPGVYSDDFDWAGTWVVQSSPKLTGGWNRFNASGVSLGAPATVVQQNNATWAWGAQRYANKAHTATGFTVALMNSDETATVDSTNRMTLLMETTGYQLAVCTMAP